MHIIYAHNACIITITKNRLVLLLIGIISLIALLTKYLRLYLSYILFSLLEGTRHQTTCAFQLQLNSGFKLLTLSKGIKKKLQLTALSCCSWLVVRRGESWIINLQALEKSGTMFYFLALFWALNTGLVPTQTQRVVWLMYVSEAKWKRAHALQVGLLKYAKYIHMYFIFKWISIQTHCL